MDLLYSRVPRSLETKTKIFGFDLDDVLVVFLYLAVSNLCFGSTRFKFAFVWCGTASVAAVLYTFKRGRPEGYLQDAVQHWLNPPVLSSSCPDTEYAPLFQEDL